MMLCYRRLIDDDQPAQLRIFAPAFAAFAVLGGAQRRVTVEFELANHYPAIALQPRMRRKFARRAPGNTDFELGRITAPSEDVFAGKRTHETIRAAWNVMARHLDCPRDSFQRGA